MLADGGLERGCGRRRGRRRRRARRRRRRRRPAWTEPWPGRRRATNTTTRPSLSGVEGGAGGDAGEGDAAGVGAQRRRRARAGEPGPDDERRVAGGGEQRRGRSRHAPRSASTRQSTPRTRTGSDSIAVGAGGVGAVESRASTACTIGTTAATPSTCLGGGDGVEREAAAVGGADDAQVGRAGERCARSRATEPSMLAVVTTMATPSATPAATATMAMAARSGCWRSRRRPRQPEDPHGAQRLAGAARRRVASAAARPRRRRPSRRCSTRRPGRRRLVVGDHHEGDAGVGDGLGEDVEDHARRWPSRGCRWARRRGGAAAR